MLTGLVHCATDCVHSSVSGKRGLDRGPGGMVEKIRGRVKIQEAGFT